MIRSFAAQGSRNVFDGVDSKAARRTSPSALWPTARRKLDQLRADREGQNGIRINKQYRVCFRTALRLAKLLRTTPEFWLNGQRNWDLWQAMHSPEAREVERIAR